LQIERLQYDGINDKLFDLQKSYHKNLMSQDFQVISISKNRKKFEMHCRLTILTRERGEYTFFSDYLVYVYVYIVEITIYVSINNVLMFNFFRKLYY